MVKTARIVLQILWYIQVSNLRVHSSVTNQAVHTLSSCSNVIISNK